MAEGIPAEFSHKIGPLPAYAWAAAIVGGYLVFKRSQASTSSAAGSTVPTPTAADAALAGSIVPDTAGGDASTQATAQATPSTPTTNSQWLNAAVTALIAQHLDPVTAENALNKYLSGLPLTATEHTMVSSAISAIGPPPEGAPVSGSVPTSTPPTSTPPPTGVLSPLPNGTWKIPGEYTVGQLEAQSGKGTWYLSNYGGVAAEGGAPFEGSAFTRGAGAPIPPNPPSWRYSSIRAYGQHGYQITSTRGDVQTFGS